MTLAIQRTEKRPPLGISVSAAISIGWIVLILLVALLARQIAPYDYDQIDLHSRLLPPIWLPGGSWLHPLGCDDLGRDMFSRLIQSIRVSLLVAIFGAAIGCVLGTSLGLLSAHFGRVVDELVVMAIDYQAALPFMILALAAIAFFGNSLVILIVVMGTYGWERYARIARGLALSATSQGYAVALVALGASPARIYLRHVLPNIASALIVCLTLTFPQIILVETSLSFLGLGVQPPQTSLGSMVGFGRDYLLTAWWIAVSPAVVIFLTTLAMSTLGDWLADRLNPELSG